MDLNPLMWIPSQFIAVSAIIAFIAVLLAILLRNRSESTSVEDKELNLLELAYLAGGSKRMVETLLTGLLISKSATWSADGHSIHILIKGEASVGSIPLVQELARSKKMSQLEFRKKLRRLVNGIQSELAQRGYLQNAREARTFHPVGWLFMCTGFILSIIKTPNDYFHAAVLITLALILSIPSRQMAAAKNALKNYKARAGGVSRVSLDEDLPLAVALNGVKALSGTGYDVMFAEAKERGWTAVAYREGVAGEDGFVLY